MESVTDTSVSGRNVIGIRSALFSDLSFDGVEFVERESLALLLPELSSEELEVLPLTRFRALGLAIWKLLTEPDGLMPGLRLGPSEE